MLATMYDSKKRKLSDAIIVTTRHPAPYFIADEEGTTNYFNGTILLDLAISPDNTTVRLCRANDIFRLVIVCESLNKSLVVCDTLKVKEGHRVCFSGSRLVILCGYPGKLLAGDVKHSDCIFGRRFTMDTATGFRRK